MGAAEPLEINDGVISISPNPTFESLGLTNQPYAVFSFTGGNSNATYVPLPLTELSSNAAFPGDFSQGQVLLPGPLSVWLVQFSTREISDTVLQAFYRVTPLGLGLQQAPVWTTQGEDVTTMLFVGVDGLLFERNNSELMPPFSGQITVQKLF